MQVQAYLMFDGRCEEAIEFYKQALGAKVGTLMRNDEAPEPMQGLPAGNQKKILHADFTVGQTQLLASDGMCSGKADFKGISLTISAADVAEAERLFKAISDGGTVTMPMTKTFFSPAFGMAADRFGVPWMVIAEEPKGAA